ncbi:hypothetical protein D9M68_795500 [compost metagenome]
MSPVSHADALDPNSLSICSGLNSSRSSCVRASLACEAATKPPSKRGSSGSAKSACRTASKMGANIAPSGNLSRSSGKQRKADVFNIPLSRIQRIASTSRPDVSLIRCWFHGSPRGMLSRLGVVRYGPCTRKPRWVGTTVGKNTTSGDAATGCTDQRPGASLTATSEKATSTRPTFSCVAENTSRWNTSQF